MKKPYIWLLAILLLAGCSREKPEVASPTLKVWDENRSEQSVYRLLPDGQKILESLLARKPDTDIKAGISLEPSGVLMLNNIEYWIEPDEIILSANDGTKVWEKNGIRKDLIQHSNKLYQ